MCDRFIEAYDQKLLNIEFLLLPSIVKRLSWESVKQNIEEMHKDENNPDWNIADTVNRYYTLQSHVLDQLPKLNTAEKRTLKKLILSPNSYVRKNHYKDKCLGCCGECFKGFEHMKQNEDSVIKFSVANGMIFGSPPGALTPGPPTLCLIASRRLGTVFLEMRRCRSRSLKLGVA